MPVGMLGTRRHVIHVPTITLLFYNENLNIMGLGNEMDFSFPCPI
jgi:hypothetical protein